MSATGTAYLHAATTAVGLLRASEVAESWTAPSALPDFSVGGLAGHLAVQILQVPRVLAAEGDGDLLSLDEYYGRSTWIGAGLDAETNVQIRRGGEELAADGPAAVASRADEALAALRDALPDQPADRVVYIARLGISMRLDDYLTTRLMEIAVHVDDLAVSVGVGTPALPQRVLDPVFALLTSLAVRRHGATAVLRALARAERAPETIAAF